MVDRTTSSPEESRGVASEQLRYARLLEYGTRAGLAALIASFVAYIAGWMPPLVPLEDLPRLWGLPVEDYLRASGMPPGWGWTGLLARGDMLALGCVAFLAGLSLPCLALLLPAYARREDRAHLAIAATLVAVLVLAASGLAGMH